VAFRPIHGFATAISKAFFRHSQMTLTPPRGRGFLKLNEQDYKDGLFSQSVGLENGEGEGQIPMIV